jgi:hypothetical protein
LPARIFGFLADPAFGLHSGDYGLEDQQAALRRGPQNIASFGGDPQADGLLDRRLSAPAQHCDAAVRPALTAAD